MTTPKPRKRDHAQAVMTVQEKRRLTPGLVRLVLGGPGFSTIRDNSHTDSYVKLLLPEPGSGLLPPYDLDAIRRDSPELLPMKRTYTVRRWDRDRGEIWIDVVIHNEPGHTGIASDWADSALPGDDIAVMGAGGGYSPNPSARFHLLVGDLATAPAIAASLEAMPDDARGAALIQVEHAENRLLDLRHPEGVPVSWIVGDQDDLVDAVTKLSIEDSIVADRGVQVFCHAERGLTKRLRHHLVAERGIDRADISISAYWAQGRIEDEFQAEKKEPIGRIDPAA